MKQIPVPELIEGKKLLFVDDSIVRGTQLGETVEFLYSTHAKEVHMRSACPPIMYGCKYLNFTSKSSEVICLHAASFMTGRLAGGCVSGRICGCLHGKRAVLAETHL